MILRPLHALLVVLLVVATILGLRGRVLQAERNAALAQASKAKMELQALEVSVAEANAGIERLAAQGRALQSSQDQATARARALQVATAAKVDQVMHSVSVPKDADGALDWLHASTAAAAQGWETKR